MYTLRLISYRHYTPQGTTEVTAVLFLVLVIMKLAYNKV
jgi:hypothetical protein